jgi:predicted metal-binding transcription factor (methanogenesis marker protein 9)
MRSFSERSPIVADDKTKTGAADRSRVSGGEPYEVKYFADKHGISMERARQIIHEAGNDRARADQLASKK